MAIYNFLTLGQLRQQIADTLYDRTQIFWSPSELNLYINEALQTFNALTSFWRGDFLFNAASPITWYDLSSPTQLPNTLRPITVTDRQLYTMIQYHLLEAIAWNPWTGASAQYDENDLVTAVETNRDELLSATSCTMTRRTVGAVAGRITLPDTVIDIRRIAYLPNPPGAISTVFADDTWGEQSFESSYLQNPAGTPETFLQSIQPPISFDVNRPPAFAGLYELITLEAGPSLLIATPQTLGVPDDWTHVIKWGALFDLLSRESNANDPLRAAYCAQRYEMGKKAMGLAPALLALRNANIPLQIDSAHAADLYNTGWQSATPASPSIALHMGLNLIALAPPPSTGPYSLTATVIRNAPLPSADADPVQVAREDVNAIIDYAQHLAAFKQGGAEFSRSMALFNSFMDQCKLYNRKLAELGEFTSAIYELSQREEDMNPSASPAPEESNAS